ncbi:TRAP transporter small permease subunit [Albirhodobacter sp. R86504]|jgi:TRAP-type mannitol/chloroaromatic compound transport system permease small subunit|uniref:TRAP transporter small permease subunit n=1 Tax=Albirhodobacter sp. R86504 TaxID=3093848 RepID=UPI00366B18A5
MSSFLGLARRIDALTAFCGRHVSWLLLAAVLVSTGNAIMRKAFNLASNSWLELQWYFFGAVFMLTAADALRRNAHVRIDVLTTYFSKRTRDIIDLVCHVTFLLPFCLLMTWLSWPYFMTAAKSGEVSANYGGLILWPAKLLILLGFALLLAQSISEIIKRWAVLKGAMVDTQESAGLDLT